MAQHKVCVTADADQSFRTAVLHKYGTAAIGRGVMQREASLALEAHAKRLTRGD